MRKFRQTKKFFKSSLKNVAHNRRENRRLTPLAAMWLRRYTDSLMEKHPTGYWEVWVRFLFCLDDLFFYQLPVLGKTYRLRLFGVIICIELREHVRWQQIILLIIHQWFSSSNFITFKLTLKIWIGIATKPSEESLSKDEIMITVVESILILKVT